MRTLRVAWLRARAEWRRRWPALLALTVLVGLVGAVVLGAVAGARRTRSSVDRFTTATKSLDSFLAFGDGATDPGARIAALPEVEAAGAFAGFSGFPDGAPAYLFFVAPADPALGTEVVRDLLLDGRRPHAGEPYELAVPESLAAEYDLEVGDTWAIGTFSAQQGACFTGADNAPSPEACAPLFGFFEHGGDPSLLEGPRLDFRVVGITRGPFDVARSAAGATVVVTNQGLLELVGDRTPQYGGMVVRYAPEVTDSEFEAALAAVVDRDEIPDLDPSSAVIGTLSTTAAVLANGLTLFAAVAAAVGLVAIGQALARQVAGTERERSALRALGLSRGGRAVDALAPMVPVALGGAMLAIAGAWAISPIMPFGVARRFEPNPGPAFDGRVLLGGATLLFVLVLVFGVAGIAFAGLGGRARSRGARRVVRAGRVSRSLGVWLALDPGGRGGSAPVRTAVSGAALGIAGVVAAAGFAAGLARLVDEPVRYGYGWDATVSGCPDGNCGSDAGPAVAEHPDVDGVARLRTQGRVVVGGRSEPGFAQQAVEGDVGLPIVVGRAPRADDEVALGGKTLTRLGIHVGDRIDLEGRAFDVVGQALFPGGRDDFPLAEGVLFTDAGMHLLPQVDADELPVAFVVRLAPGVDREDALDRLAEVNGGQPPAVPTLPVEVDDLWQVRRLPLLLAAFLIVVALLAVGHAVAVTVRRRARDIGIARALGLAPRDASAVVRWAATTFSALGLALGVPVGLLLGRFAWDRVADSYGIADDPAWPWAVLIAVVPVTLALTIVIAWIPARRAARLRPAEVLRSE